MPTYQQGEQVERARPYGHWDQDVVFIRSEQTASRTIEAKAFE